MTVLFLHVAPYPQLCLQKLSPAACQRGSQPLDRCLPPSPTVADIWNKALSFPKKKKKKDIEKFKCIILSKRSQFEKVIYDSKYKVF